MLCIRETCLLHIAGDTQQILSGVMIDMDPELLENYAKLLGRMYTLSFQPFYQGPNLSIVSSIVKERIEEGISIHEKQLVDYATVKQRHMLWYKLTSPSFLPLFPCKHILPII